MHRNPTSPLSFTIMKLSDHLLLVIAVFVVLAVFPSPILSRDSEEYFETCHSNFSCGDALRNLSFPFHGGWRPPFCGKPGFELRCMNNVAFININDLEHRVLNVSQDTSTITLARSDLWSVDLCRPKPQSLNLTTASSFRFAPTVRYLNLIYDCPDDGFLPSVPHKFSCSGSNDRSFFYLNDSVLDSVVNRLGECRSNVIKVPVSRSGYAEVERYGGNEGHIRDALKKGFDLSYGPFPDCDRCESSGGHCGNNGAFFLCFCGDQTELHSCRKSGIMDKWGYINMAIGISVLLIMFCVIPISVIAICCGLGKRLLTFWRKRKNNRDLEAFIRNYEDLTVKRYKFTAVKRMTKSFKEKLGEGGFGVVYKGKLRDGRPVAVKLLNSSKVNGEVQFVNEVASICTTSHVNIVTLLGFCLEGQRKALIYEYLPNGSLEKFAFKDNLSVPKIEWEKLLQIATGIARGLEYLHRGCKTKILHLDIKPHNILLDEDFCPKISDFGLSKICTLKESIVSLMQARGTIGYVAPEVFNRNFGGVSSKSDVYSYGMMILEMVGGRKNIDVEVNHTSEIYFPDWIYKQLESTNDLQMQSDMTSEENDIARKMIIIGLWCIQTNSTDRPSMSRVIEMLETREALCVPPKPTFSLPEGSSDNFPTELDSDSLMPQ